MVDARSAPGPSGSVPASPVVSTLIFNGLGNQLFQYTAGRATAAGLGVPAVFEWSGREEPSVLGVPGFADTIDRLQIQLPPQPGRARLTPAERVRRRWLLGRGALSVVRQEVPQSYAPRPDLSLGDSTRILRLDGQFQHPSWFEPALDATIDRLGTWLATGTAYRWAQDRTVISFRRGDFARPGWILGLDYYRRALERIPAGDRATVVSDDHEFGQVAAAWLREQGVRTESADAVGEPSIERDLALLAGARTVVMSNSTFCWWGSVTGDHLARAAGRPRAVLAPSPWLPLPHSDVLLRAGWTTIDAG